MWRSLFSWVIFWSFAAFTTESIKLIQFLIKFHLFRWGTSGQNGSGEAAENCCLTLCGRRNVIIHAVNCQKSDWHLSLAMISTTHLSRQLIKIISSNKTLWCAHTFSLPGTWNWNAWLFTISRGFLGLEGVCRGGSPGVAHRE